MPSPLGEGQTDVPINRLHLGEVQTVTPINHHNQGEVPSSHPNSVFLPSAFIFTPRSLQNSSFP